MENQDEFHVGFERILVFFPLRFRIKQQPTSQSEVPEERTSVLINSVAYKGSVSSLLTLICTTSWRTKRGRLTSEMTRGPVSVSRSFSSSLNLNVTMLDALSSGLISTSAKLNWPW